MDPSGWYGRNEERSEVMDVDDDERVVKSGSGRVGGGDLKATFLVTSDAALLFVPLHARIDGRQNRLDIVRARSKLGRELRRGDLGQRNKRASWTANFYWERVGSGRVGSGDLKATFLVTSDAALLFFPLRVIAASGSMAGRTGSTSSGRGASWVESCEVMISSSGTKEHHGRLTSTDTVHPLHHLAARAEHCIVLSYEITMFTCNGNYTSLVITNTTYTIPSMGTVLALLFGPRQ
jgi:hypothetical protein